MSLIRFSPCGKQLVAAGHDGAVHRWDVTGRAPAALPPLTGHHDARTRPESALLGSSWHRSDVGPMSPARPYNGPGHGGFQVHPRRTVVLSEAYRGGVGAGEP